MNEYVIGDVKLLKVYIGYVTPNYVINGSLN